MQIYVDIWNRLFSYVEWYLCLCFCHWSFLVWFWMSTETSAEHQYRSVRLSDIQSQFRFIGISRSTMSASLTFCTLSKALWTIVSDFAGNILNIAVRQFHIISFIFTYSCWNIGCSWNVVRKNTAKSQNSVENMCTIFAEYSDHVPDSVRLRRISCVCWRLHCENLDIFLFLLVCIFNLPDRLDSVLFSEYFNPFRRTPFELDSTLRCAVVALYQLFSSIMNYLSFQMAFYLLIEYILYARSFVANVGILFDDIDRMTSRTKFCESSVLELIRQAIKLHNRIIM